MKSIIAKIPVRRLVRKEYYEEAYRLAFDLKEKFKEKTPSGVLYYGTCALFGLGHIRQAENWIESYEKIGENTSDYLYLKAYLQLHNGNTGDAILSWTRILQLDPSSTFADRLIEWAGSRESDLVKTVKAGQKFYLFVPVPGMDINNRKKTIKFRLPESGNRSLLLWVTVVPAFVIIFLLLLYSNVIYKKLQIELNVLRENRLPNPPGKVYLIPESDFEGELPLHIYKSPSAALSDYELARERISSGYVNQGIYLINRIELSNAGFELKERAKLLREFIPIPERLEFKDSLLISRLMEEPAFYRGVYVLWEGSVISSQEQKGEINIDFKLHEQSPVVAVRYRVSDGFDVNIPSVGDRIEVFGRFIDVNRDGRYLLDASYFAVKSGKNSRSYGLERATGQ